MEAAVTDMTYRDLFARHRDLRQKLARARSSAEAGAIQAQIDVIRDLRITIHMQLMELLGAGMRRGAS
jgi:ribosomal protein L29